MKNISLIIALLIISISAHAEGRVGGGGVFSIQKPIANITDEVKVGGGGVYTNIIPVFTLENRVGSGGISFVGNVAGLILTNGQMISSLGPVVGGGGVSFAGQAILPDDSKVGTGGVFSLQNGGNDPDTTVVINNEMIKKLKIIGVEKLLLENGETVDLNGGEGSGSFVSGNGEGGEGG